MSTYLGNTLINGKNIPDNTTIAVNSGNKISAVGAVNSNVAKTDAVKFWTGTRAEYDAILTKDPNTLYNITNDQSDSIGYPQRVLGQVIESTLPLVDAGLHLLDGALINGNGIYKAFVDYIANLYTSGSYTSLFVTEASWQTAVETYGVCGKFVYNSTNNTVRLPKITGVTEGTTTVSALGDLIQAGLPNITGYSQQIIFKNGNNNSRSGCLDYQYLGEYWDSNSGGSYQGDRYQLNIDASRSSSIYGNASTVQPQAIKVLYYIVVATSAKTEVQVDLDDVATDLNGKADTDLTNLDNTGKSAVAHLAMPSTTSIALTAQWETEGAIYAWSYTAPADGYIYFFGVADSNSQIIAIQGVSSGLQAQANISTAGGGWGISLPVAKGHVVKFITFAGLREGSELKFVYAIGSAHEAS